MMSIISASYPTSQSFNSEDVRNVWFEMLKPYKAADVFAQLTQHIKTNAYPPAIANLIPQEKVVDVQSEWHEIIRLIGKYGYYRQAECMEMMTDAQAAAVRAIGYARICQSEPNALYREFTQVFKPISTQVMLI